MEDAMQMHVGRKVLAFGLTALVVGASAGSALAASTESSPAASTPVVVVASPSATATSLPPLQKLTPAQVAAQIHVSTKALLGALNDAKAQVAKAGLTKDAARDLTIKVLVADLHISKQDAAWAADELLGGYITGVPAKK
jgi:hypothetical protein